MLIVHDPGQSKIGDQQIGVVLGGAEEEVLGLEITVHDAVGVEVGDSGEGGEDQGGGVGFIVVTFAADAVEELAAQGEVGDEVEVVLRLEVVDEGEDVPVAHGDALEDCDFVADLVRSARASW